MASNTALTAAETHADFFADAAMRAARAATLPRDEAAADAAIAAIEAGLAAHFEAAAPAMVPQQHQPQQGRDMRAAPAPAVTVTHVDTCLACYITDHHNRPGELLVGVAVDGGSRVHHVRVALLDDIATALASRASDRPDFGDNPPDMATVSAAIFDAFKAAHPLKSFNKAMPPKCERDEAGQPCEAWFLITWPVAADEPAPAMVPQPVQPQQARALPPMRLAPAPARLYPAAHAAIMAALPVAGRYPADARFAQPGGTFAAMVAREPAAGPHAVRVNVATMAAPHRFIARFGRIFVNDDAAAVYLGRLAALATYRRLRAYHLRWARQYRAEGYPALADECRRQLRALRAEHADNLTRFGAKPMSEGDKAAARIYAAALARRAAPVTRADLLREDARAFEAEGDTAQARECWRLAAIAAAADALNPADCELA